MVAGATGIDLFLLVVDAAEGARPQTHEHLAILRLLGVERGVVAVTKADAVDSETLELAVLRGARARPRGATVVAVSGVTGAGLDELRAALATGRGGRRAATRPTFPPGCTSTACSRCGGSAPSSPGRCGRARSPKATTLRLEPAGRDVRVRSVQVHDTPVERAEAGQRVAVSLPGVERADVRRGDALVAAGAFPRSYRLEVALDGARADRERCPSLGAPRDEQDPRARRARGRRPCPAAARRSRRRCARRSRRASNRDDRRRRDRPRPGPAPSASTPSATAFSSEGDPPSIVRALVHEPVSGRGRGGARAAGRRRARGGPRRRPRRRRLGVLGRLARGDLRAGRGRSCAREPSARRSTRACRSPSCSRREPWAASVLGLLPVERRGPKGYLPGAAAGLGRARRCGGGARGDARSRRARRRRRSTTPSSRGSSRQRAASSGSGDGFAVAAGAYEVARDLVVDRGAPRRARSRSRGSATSRASAAATRSSCSSGWTWTASRAGSATGGCCGERRRGMPVEGSG